MQKKLFKDFCVFSKYQLESWDIDPVYPVLKEYYRLNDMGRNESHWFTLLYVTYYHLGSAEKMFDMYPKPRKIDEKWATHSTGIERRGFRGNKLAAKHLNAAIEKIKVHGGITKWVCSTITDDKPRISWRKTREEFQTLPYAGPWSSYKWVDLLKNVHDWSIAANDIGVGGNSETAGPIPGMVMLTKLDWKECAINVKVQKNLLNNCLDEGVKFSGLDQLETCLCDFNSLVKGHYYSGHDIDMQMEQMPDREIWWEARRHAIPQRCRGEAGKQRWGGVRKELKTLYRDQGIIYTDLVR